VLLCGPLWEKNTIPQRATEDTQSITENTNLRLYLYCMQQDFATRVLNIIKDDESIVGLAAGGSWISNSLDKFSDLDLILFTKEKISHDAEVMRDYARRFGKLLASFTGEHVGEPRLLICLYDDPLLHVDIKFLIPGELETRIEDPVILFARSGELEQMITKTKAEFPTDSFQWLEDRFWVWIHYLAARLGRAEYFECIDGLTFIRSRVLGALLHKKYGQQPRGVRRIESIITETELMALKETVPSYDRSRIFQAIEKTIALYRTLRQQLFEADVQLNLAAEQKALAYLDDVEWS
jgi:hypothetical protein